jgi:hypothetical protein
VLMSSLTLPHLLLFLSTTFGGQSSPGAATPETFTASAQAKGATAAVTATVEVHLQRYTPEFDRTAVETALKQGGYPAFLSALRRAPNVGHVTLAGQETPIRWARERKTEKGRTITVVTDKPIFFIGGGAAAPKSRAGYEVGVIQLNVDPKGTGDGLMAAAARVKPGGDAGVVIDDYADQPITLTAVRRKS